MAMQVKRLQDGSETWSKKTGDCTSAEIKYLVINATSKEDAIHDVLDNAPETYGNLPFKEVRVDSYENGNLELSAVYAKDDEIGGGDYSNVDEEATESFDCGGGTKHMTHAISQKRVFGGTDDDAGGGIGWNGKSGSEAEFSGVDVPCADMRETYTKAISRNKATSTAYKRQVAALVGKVNSARFKGWEPGEIMFLGSSYSTPSKGANKVTMSYNFRIMPNENNAVVAGHKCGKKKGFEYLWARSEVVNDTKTNTPKVETKSIYLSEVCETANFGAMGL